MNQLDLFAHSVSEPTVQQAQAERDLHEGQRRKEAPVARARTKDPQSSKTAAADVIANGTAADHRDRILAVIQRGGGWTSYELAKATGLSNVQVSRRLSGMKGVRKADDSLARTCRVLGKKLTTYWDERMFQGGDE